MAVAARNTSKLQLVRDRAAPPLPKIYGERDVKALGDKVAAAFKDPKETEDNWQQRDAAIDLLHGLLFTVRWKVVAPARKIALTNGMLKDFKQYAAATQAVVRRSLPGLAQAMQSLRTQLALKACKAATDLVIAVPEMLDGPGTDQLTTTAVKLCGQTKKLTIQAAAELLETVIVSMPGTRLVPMLVAALADKNKDLRLIASGLLLLILQHWTAATLTKVGLDTLRDIIKKGVGDAQPAVRENMRLAFWAFRARFPANADAMLNTLDPSTIKLVRSSQGSFAVHPARIFRPDAEPLNNVEAVATLPESTTTHTSPVASALSLHSIPLQAPPPSIHDLPGASSSAAYHANSIDDVDETEDEQEEFPLNASTSVDVFIDEASLLTDDWAHASTPWSAPPLQTPVVTPQANRAAMSPFESLSDQKHLLVLSTPSRFEEDVLQPPTDVLQSTDSVILPLSDSEAVQPTDVVQWTNAATLPPSNVEALQPPHPALQPADSALQNSGTPLQSSDAAAEPSDNAARPPADFVAQPTDAAVQQPSEAAASPPSDAAPQPMNADVYQPAALFQSYSAQPTEDEPGDFEEQPSDADDDPAATVFSVSGEELPITPRTPESRPLWSTSQLQMLTPITASPQWDSLAAFPELLAALTRSQTAMDAVALRRWRRLLRDQFVNQRLQIAVQRSLHTILDHLEARLRLGRQHADLANVLSVTGDVLATAVALHECKAFHSLLSALVGLDERRHSLPLPAQYEIVRAFEKLLLREDALMLWDAFTRAPVAMLRHMHVLLNVAPPLPPSIVTALSDMLARSWASEFTLDRKAVMDCLVALETNEKTREVVIAAMSFVQPSHVQILEHYLSKLV